MSDVGDAFRVPQYIEARSKEDLVRAMLLNNLQHGMEFRYFDISKDGRNWIAWFNFQLDRKQFIIDKVING